MTDDGTGAVDTVRAQGAAIRRLKSVGELFELVGDDYLLRTDASPEQSIAGLGSAWLADDGGFAFGAQESSSPGAMEWLTVIGPAESSRALFDHALADLPRTPHGFSVPRGTDLSGVEFAEPTAWDYMVFDPKWGAAPAVVPGEERVEEVAQSAEADAEIGAFLKVANPSHSAKPGWDAIRAWGVVRGADGELLACGAYCRRTGENGYLASIGTHPDARGQGLGAAVSAWLTRRSLAAGDGFCSLGHWHPNEPARRIYLRLGYRTTHRMDSGRFPA